MALKSKEVSISIDSWISVSSKVLMENKKAIKFSCFAKSKSQEEIKDLVIRFVLFQKEKLDEGDITSCTLRNYVRAVKLFCRMNRITIFWDII
jgi:hypothetical protein